MDEMAAAEKISPSYISRILRLSYLSPNYRRGNPRWATPRHLTMKDLLLPFPLAWAEQKRHLYDRPAVVRVDLPTYLFGP